MNQNLFIIGPVASGKTTITEHLKDKYNLDIVDTGILFRVFAKSMINCYNLSLATIRNIVSNDIKFSNEVNFLNSQKKIFNKIISSISYKDNSFFMKENKIKREALYSPEINDYVRVVAKSNVVRKYIMDCINALPITSDKRRAWTGHNINGIDTTKFTTIFLDISNEEAAKRLIKRTPESYNSFDDALNEVVRRNNNDGISITKDIIQNVYNAKRIDTTNKSIEEVILEIDEHIQFVDNRNNEFQNIQSQKSIKKEDFKWLNNPFLSVLKTSAEEFIDNIISKRPELNKNDLMYQYMINISANDVEQLIRSENIDLKNIDKAIKERDDKTIEDFMSEFKNGRIKVNKEKIESEVIKQAKILVMLYEKDGVTEFMQKLNEPKNRILDISRTLDFDFQKVNAETSDFIARYCHYLHTPRQDEFASYGIFEKGSNFPLAWVSYSKQDRDYKKQALNFIGIESHNTLEMTRAWCQDSSPVNVMSYLFQKSIDAIEQEWRENSKLRKTSNNLQAITTAINPNLGFHASSFKGGNFLTYALRPAKFTFGVDNDGNCQYSTRRNIEENNLTYTENKFSILPLNEMIKFVNIKKENEFDGTIIQIDDRSYNSALKSVSNNQNKKKNAMIL